MFTHRMFTHPHLLQLPQQRAEQPVVTLYSKGVRIECGTLGGVKTALDEQDKMQQRRRRLALFAMEHVR